MRTRHIDKFWRCFENVEKEGCIFPKKSGKVTPVHFMQHFPFLKDFSTQDVNVLLQRYTEDTGGVNVKAMGQDLEEALENIPDRRKVALPPGFVRRQKDPKRSASTTSLRPSTCPASFGTMTTEKPPAGQRPLTAASMKKSHSAASLTPQLQAVPRPSSAAFANLTNIRRSQEPKEVDTMIKVRSFLAERDIRLVDLFRDYDRLRKGVCTMNQAFSVFTVAGLQFSSADHDTLLNLYHDEAGRFRYRDFCVDAAKSSEESLDGRPPHDKRRLRHPGALDQHEQAVLDSVLDRMSKRVRDRGMEIRTLFEDFRQISAICPAGHVTKGMFSRIMSMLNFAITNQELDVLTHRFGDCADGDEFNYLDFCDVIDPRPPPAEPMVDTKMPSYTAFKSRHYFDTAGRIIPRAALPGLTKQTAKRYCH
jgi:Ca2+-binding EF-hand superfamily protein